VARLPGHPDGRRRLHQAHSEEADRDPDPDARRIRCGDRRPDPGAAARSRAPGTLGQQPGDPRTLTGVPGDPLRGDRRVELREPDRPRKCSPAPGGPGGAQAVEASTRDPRGYRGEPGSKALVGRPSQQGPRHVARPEGDRALPDRPRPVRSRRGRQLAAEREDDDGRGSRARRPGRLPLRSAQQRGSTSGTRCVARRRGTCGATTSRSA
jgi:hypothetical protein